MGNVTCVGSAHKQFKERVNDDAQLHSGCEGEDKSGQFICSWLCSYSHVGPRDFLFILHRANLMSHSVLTLLWYERTRRKVEGIVPFLVEIEQCTSIHEGKNIIPDHPALRLWPPFTLPTAIY